MSKKIPVNLKDYINERQVKRILYDDPDMVGSENKIVDKRLRSAIKSMEKGEYFNALLSYNEVLACVEPHEGLSYIFDIRSVIYERCHLWNECLDNIYLAERYETDIDYTERKEMCNRELEKQANNAEPIEPKDQLSYPSNERIPFVVDCLKLKSDRVNGSQVYTDQELKKGDIISIESPLFETMSTKFPSHSTEKTATCFQRCSTCFKYNHLSLIQCEHCSNEMYCTFACRTEAYEKYHKYECAIINSLPGVEAEVRKMRSFFISLYHYGHDIRVMRRSFEKIERKPKTVFDFVLSFVNSMQQSRLLMRIFHSCRSIERTPHSRMLKEMFDTHPELAPMWRGNEDFIIEFMRKHDDNIQQHGQAIIATPTPSAEFGEVINICVPEIIGVGYYPFSAMIKHSELEFNVTRKFNNDKELILTASRDIGKGEVLYDDYK